MSNNVRCFEISDFSKACRRSVKHYNRLAISLVLLFRRPHLLKAKLHVPHKHAQEHAKDTSQVPETLSTGQIISTGKPNVPEPLSSFRIGILIRDWFWHWSSQWRRALGDWVIRRLGDWGIRRFGRFG